MTKALRSRQTEFVLLILVVLAALVVSRSPIRPSPFGDGYFHEEAKSLSHAVHTGDWISVIPFEHAPLPAIYYLPAYIWVRDGSPDSTFWLIGVLWNLFWLYIGLILIQASVRKFAGKLSALCAVGLVLASPMSLYYSFGIFAEPIAFLGCSLILWSWAGCLVDVPSQRRCKPICLFLGLILLTLSRPNAVLVYPLGLIALLLVTREVTDPAPFRGALTALSAAFVVLVCSLALTGFWLHAKGKVNQSSFLTHVMIQGAYQFRTEPSDWRQWSKTARSDSADYRAYSETRASLDLEAKQKSMPVAEVERTWLLDSMMREPQAWLKMDTIRLLASHVFLESSKPAVKFGLGPLKGRIGYTLVHIALNLAQGIAVIGSIFFIFKMRPVSLYWALWAPWCALALFTMATYEEPRYLFPAQPLLAAMGGCSLARLASHLRARWRAHESQQATSAGESLEPERTLSREFLDRAPTDATQEPSHPGHMPLVGDRGLVAQLDSQRRPDST